MVKRMRANCSLARPVSCDIECRLSGNRHVGYGSGAAVPAPAKQSFPASNSTRYFGYQRNITHGNLVLRQGNTLIELAVDLAI